tara:strand:+ start:14311 stop:15999 length:1689 start_codon:yes stop_codon:yes gene_type:complete
MAFRFQSAIAGGAKRLSEKMEKFDENYAETLKNTSADLRKEVKQIVKDRTAFTREYQKYGQRLRDMGLSDGQIQTVLQSGVDRYDEFVEALNNQEQIHVLSKQPGEFNRQAAAQAMFQGTETGDILSFDDQAVAFGAAQVPSTLDLEGTAASVAAGTQFGIFKADPSDVRAAFGDIGSDIQQGPVMSDTGLTIPGLGAMTADEIVAARRAQAELEDLQETTKGRKATTRLAAANAQAAEITNQQLPQQLRAELDGTYASTALREMQTRGVEQDISIAILEQEKLREELVNYQKYGAKEKELALDLLEAKIRNANSPADLEQLMAIYMQDADTLTQEAAAMEDGPEKIGKLEQAGMLRIRVGGIQNAITDMDSTSSSATLKNPETRFNAALKVNLQNQNITGEFDAVTNLYKYDFANKRPAYITGYSNTVDQFRGLYASSSAMGLTAANEYQTQLGNQINNWSRTPEKFDVVGGSESTFILDDFLTGTGAKITEINTAREMGSSGVPTKNFDFGLQDSTTISKLGKSGVLMAGDIVRYKMPNSDQIITAMFGSDGEWIAAGGF